VRRTVNRTKRYRHIGLDFLASTGTPVKAMNDGTVVLSTEQWTPGQTVIVDHGGSIFSKYNHLSERRVREGDAVTRGQVIALSGRSGGQKTPPHLHLDIFINRTPVDPEDFMRTAARLISG
jgi:murein DD-endopeptidase MepM/ murein hydrolase activator NlpD